MTAIRRFAALAVLFVVAPCLSAAAPSDDQRDYVLAPLRTEFHRSEISSKGSAILIVNANAVDASRAGDVLASCRTTMEADLRALSQRTGDVLLIRIQHSGSKPLEKEVIVRLKDQLKELAIKSGYSETQISEQWTSADWKSSSGALGTGLIDDPGDENLIINETLVAAPLRTRISKLHAGMADVNIKLRCPFDAHNQQLSDQTKDRIRKAVQSMELKRARSLHFSVSSTKAGAECVDTLFSNRQPPAIPDDAPAVIKDFLLKEREGFQKSPALKLAEELGFQEISCAHSSNGGAPELLLEKQAPDFELKSLNGSLVKWSEWRSGRPALVTFWGVACGPCRIEAPYLSRLHEKYGDRVAIIGINAYDEPDETILAYVTKEKLKHQIVVGGSKVATSSYKVAAYPTTFWINRRGDVVRYVVGFESGEQLEAELTAFLADEKQ